MCATYRVPAETFHTRTSFSLELEGVEAPSPLSLELDAEHKEDKRLPLKRRPGPSLVPTACLYRWSPAVIDSRRAIRCAFLSCGGSSTSAALSSPSLHGWKGVAAGGPTAAFDGSPCVMPINRRVGFR